MAAPLRRGDLEATGTVTIRELGAEGSGGLGVAGEFGEAEAEGEDLGLVKLVFGEGEEELGGFGGVVEVERTFDGGEGQGWVGGVGSFEKYGAAGFGGEGGGGVVDLFEVDEFVAIAFAADAVQPEDEDEADEEEGDVEEDRGPHDAGDHAEDFSDESGDVGAAPDPDDEECGGQDEAEADAEGFLLCDVKSHEGG